MFYRNAILTALIAVPSSSAHAAISGFGDFSGFSVNQNDTSSSPTVTMDSIQLTNDGFDEARSVFANTPQDISQFTASFTYQALNIASGGYGAAFVIQNDPSGAHALGSALGNLGYAGIVNSAAVSMNMGYNGDGSSSYSGFYTGGSIGGGPTTTSPINFYSGHPINVTLTYNGSVLHENLVDTITAGTYNASYLPNLSSIVGNTAYVGFAASTSYGDVADQYISNFKFTSAVPEPCMAGVMMVGSLMALRRRR